MAYHARAANAGAVGVQITNWNHSINQKWASLHFGDVKINSNEKEHSFELQLYLYDLDPKLVRVELYAEKNNGGKPMRMKMELLQPQPDSSGAHLYAVTVPAIHPVTEFTPRVIPHHAKVSIPLENDHILWQK
jgi:starch phosphorylase